MCIYMCTYRCDMITYYYGSATPGLTLRPCGINVCRVLIQNFSSWCSSFVFSTFVALSIGCTFRSEMAWSGRLKCCEM